MHTFVEGGGVPVITVIAGMGSCHSKLLIIYDLERLITIIIILLNFRFCGNKNRKGEKQQMDPHSWNQKRGSSPILEL